MSILSLSIFLLHLCVPQYIIECIRDKFKRYHWLQKGDACLNHWHEMFTYLTVSEEMCRFHMNTHIQMWNPVKLDSERENNWGSSKSKVVSCRSPELINIRPESKTAKESVKIRLSKRMGKMKRNLRKLTAYCLCLKLDEKGRYGLFF